MFMLQLRLCGCWTVLNLILSDFSKGRQGGHRFNLGRGVCGVQVLLQNSLFWNWEASDDPLFNTGILRWVQGSGSSPTPSGKRVLLQNASCHLALQHSQVPQPLLWYTIQLGNLTSCNIIIGNLFNRMGTLGLTGQQATVEDQIYIVRVYLTKAGNLKVCTVWSI